MLIFKCLSNGRLTENIAPLPSALFSAHILPPWASIVPLEIKNPDPDPVSELVTNFENNLSYSSESIPRASILYANNNFGFFATINSFLIGLI
jgi:hypothetical protein